jgi:processive 1,2-diacylglycerol beta-glucosyltransferase
MVMYAPIPGQEERNADYLLEQGAAVKAVDELGLIWRVKQLMSSPEHLACMRKRAQAIARPDAGRDVLDVVLQDIA